MDAKDFWIPITPEELNKELPLLNKSAGPDSITSAQLHGISRVIMCKLLNLFICTGDPQVF